MKRIFTIFLLSGLVLTGCRRGLDNDTNVDDMRLLVDASIGGSTLGGQDLSASAAIAQAKSELAALSAGGVATKEQSASLTKSVWAPEDQFGLFLNIERDGKVSPMQFTGNDFNGFNYDNLIYTYRSNKFNALDVYYYPFRRNLVDLYAVYPYDAEMGKDATQNVNGSKLDKSSAGNYPWSVFADQTASGRKTGSGNATTRDESNVKQGDLLFAKQTGVAPNNTGAAQKLDFKHVMSKIKLKLLVPVSSDDKELDATNPLSGVVLMNTVLDSRVNFQMDSVFAYGTTTTSIKMLSLGSEADAGGGTFHFFECVAIPQTVGGNTYLLQATVRFADGSTSEFKMTLGAAGIQFLKGKQHDLTVVFDNKKGLRLDGSSIKDWVDGDGGSGLVGENEASPAANSFIVPTGEKVVINATLAGNDVAAITAYSRALKDPTTGVKSVRLLWQTKNGHTSDGALIVSSVNDANLKAVVVQTNAAATAGGNAVVAAYDGVDGTGNILWSWHIWVTGQDPRAGASLATYGAKFAAANGAGKAIMDRNLGALTSTQSVGMIQGGGLLYQWGRKDPFTGTSAGTNINAAVPVYDLAGAVVVAKVGSAIAGDGSFKFATSAANNVDAAIGNPMTFYSAGFDWTTPSISELWNTPTGGVKTIYDPCPDGFRVAGGDTWRDLGAADGAYGTWSGTGNTSGGVFNELGGAPFYFMGGRRDPSVSGAVTASSTNAYTWSSGVVSDGSPALVANQSVVFPGGSNKRVAGFAVRCVQDADATAHLTVMGGGAISPTGGKATVNVYSNSAWSATIAGAGFTLDAASGNGNGTITVNASALAAGAGSRTGVITVLGASGTITKTAYVSQHEPTVVIDGVEWTTTNLTGAAQGDVAGFTLSPSPTDYGMFWKWGSKYMYDRNGGALPAGHWGSVEADYNLGSATQPTTPSRDYDYANVSSLMGPGGPVGDPCQVLGANYKTPTQTQIQALHDSGKLNSQYQGVPGWFFGPDATLCDNSTLQANCIFLPMAGRRTCGGGGLYDVGTDGYYWSSSVGNSDNGWYLYFYSSGGINPAINSWRGLGFSVRCVKHTPGPPTVTIADTKWTTANLTGTSQGQTSGFTVCANPQDYGMFWKWGSKYMYARESNGNPSGHWGAYTTWAATAPTTQSKGYDYGSSSLASSFGAPVGDPCQSLGAAYKTPTSAQIKALYDTGRSGYVSYKGVKGFFFGPSASSCSDQNLISGCIFLPCAGYRRFSSGSLNNGTTGGDYWSSSVLDANSGWNLYFNGDGGIYPENADYRGNGFSVRCVQE